MTISKDQISRWLLADKENEHLEFKEAKTQYDSRKLTKYCAALANENGGHLLFGVTDRLPRHVVGSQAIPDVGRTKSQLLERLGIRIEIHEIQHPGGRVVVFDIPSRPQGRPIPVNGAYWMRSGEELVPMPPDKLQRIFAEGQVEFEKRPVWTNLQSDDVVRLLDTQSYFDLIQIPYPQNRDEVLRRFDQEQLIITEGTQYSITNMGALLFAKDIGEFPELRRKAVRVTTFDGINKLNSVRDRFHQSGFASGFESLLDYIGSQIPEPQIVGKALRQTGSLYPAIAIRELVANAIIHQDLEDFSSPVTIDIYSNRIERSNPGAPPIATDRFIDENKSKNHLTADLMRRLRICEEKGGGIDKVIIKIEASQLPAPDFRASDTRTTAILYVHKDFKNMNNTEKIRACYQHCCLKYVMSDNMNNQSLRERFGLATRSSDKASRIINATVDEKLIKLEDPSSKSKRYAKYIPYWA